MADTDSQGGSRYRWVVLALVFLAHFLAVGLVWLAVPALTAELRADLGVSTSAVLLSYAAISFALVFAQIPGGVLGDRYPIRWVVGAGVVLAGVATALRAVVPTLEGLVGASLLLAAGIALVAPNLVKVLTEWFPTSQLGLAQGANLAGYTLGAGLAGSISAGAALDVLGSWEGVFAVYGGLTVALGVAWVALVRSPRPGEVPASVGEGGDDGGAVEEVSLAADESAWQLLREVGGHRATLLASAVALFALFSIQGALGVLPTYADAVGFRVPEVLVGTPLYAGTVGALALPVLSDRVGRKAVMYAGVVGLVAGTVVVGVSASLPAFVAGMVLAGVFGGGLFAMLYVLPGEVPAIGAARAGTMAGVVLSVGQVGGTLGPLAGSLSLESVGLTSSAVAVALPALLAVPALWALDLGEEESSPERRESGAVGGESGAGE